jgi:hypothetical protein
MSAARDILENPALAYYYGQKGIRSLPVRRALGRAVVGLLGGAKPGIPVEGGTRVADELHRDGLSYLPADVATPAALEGIRAHLQDKPVIDMYDGSKRYDIAGPLPRNTVKLTYRTEDLVTCPQLVQIANHPLVLDAVAQVLGTQPVISSFLAWWTLGEHQRDTEVHFDDIYHRDVDDLRFIKLFVYLTDTDERNGAHSFVKGSHRSPALTRRGPISDEAVRAAFAPADIVTVSGKAGTAFLEDTWGIHRPLLATEGRRLVFSVLYSLMPRVPHGPRTPILPLPPGLNPLINRVFFRQ